VAEVGRWGASSLVLDAAGRPCLAYNDLTDDQHGTLHHACWTGSAWQHQLVDSSPTDSLGGEPHMTRDAQGRPVIAANDLTHPWEIRVSRWDGAAWHSETIDADPDGVAANPWTVVDGAGRIHVTTIRTGDLRHAVHDGSGWSYETIQSEGAVGHWSSMAFDSAGRPHVTFIHYDTYQLRHARWDGSAWQVEIVDYGVFSKAPWLIMGPGDEPMVAYFDSAPEGVLKVARRPPGGGWRITTVDASARVGGYSSMVRDAAGRLHVSYYDYTNQDLKYAVLE
jgi:hypothetical protein